VESCKCVWRNRRIKVEMSIVLLVREALFETEKQSFIYSTVPVRSCPLLATALDEA